MREGCRDCERCTEQGIVGFFRGLGLAVLAIGTLGVSLVVVRIANTGRRMCPVCNHPMGWHHTVGGRFKD